MNKQNYLPGGILAFFVRCDVGVYEKSAPELKLTSRSAPPQSRTWNVVGIA